MKRGLIAVAAAVLLLTGCTAQAQEAIVVSDAPAGTAAPTPQAATPTSEDTPAAAPVEVSAAPDVDSKSDTVLVGMQLAVSAYGVEVTTDQIAAAANYACDQLEAGAPQSEIVALTGDIPERANSTLVQMSADEFCPTR